MGSILYSIIIEPLVLAVELIFSLLYRALGAPGPAVVGVSVAVSILVLPLYRMADAIQQQERDKQASMARWVEHIKAHFKGDEQYMILSTYYRQQHYSQLSPLKSSFSLLLQVPFFIAAYRYLSGVQLLNGASFWFINDLSRPDELLHLGSFAVNVLPIAMTVLNIASSAVYTKGLPFRDKLQTYALALVFLVLLYRSPSGLVLYWTCNQIFSLVKNIFMKVLKNPTRDMAILVTLAVVACGVWLALTGQLASIQYKVAYALLAVVIELMALAPLFHREQPPTKRGKHAASRSATPSLEHLTFVFAALAMALLMGLTIPSALFGASPQDFIDVYDFVNPLNDIVHAACVTLGLFLLWGGVYYYLSDARGRKLVITVYLVLCASALANYFGGRPLGIVTNGLQFENIVLPTQAQSLRNVGIGIAAIVALLVAHRLFPSVTRIGLGLLCATLIVVSVPDLLNVREVAGLQEELARKIRAQSTSTADAQFDEEGNILPIAQLSTQGQNVVVLFLDRGISGYLPYFFDEKPELREQFDGFVYYPNTISHGAFTIYGAPPLYGGYEYTIAGMEERLDQTIDEKFTESVLVLPTILEDVGFNVTMTDPARTDYHDVDPNYTTFAHFERVKAYRTVGAYAHSIEGYSDVIRDNFLRNLFFYSVLKVSPMAVQHIVYDNGLYYSTRVNHAMGADFINNYSVLSNLGKLVEVVDDDSSNLFFLHNNTTHSPELLELPDYRPSLYLHEDSIDTRTTLEHDGRVLSLTGAVASEDRHTNGLEHYHINMATFLAIGNWFDELRAAGVWDNTRIIFVSDHGYDLQQFEDLIYSDDLDIERLNPLLMVKDFNATGFSTSYEFMTVADVPNLVLDDIVDNPVNPFTGNPITTEDKSNPQLVTTSRRNQAYHHPGSTYDTSDRHRYLVHDDLFDFNNWQLLD